MRPLILASSSPRRRRLLRELGVPFSVRAAAVDERPRPGEAPAAHVRRLALAKARAVARGLSPACGARWVLGADTVIALDGEILGKPRGPRDAERMLARLAGRTHEVLTGVALVPVRGPASERGLVAAVAGQSSVAVVRSRVTMRPFDAAAIRRYVASGEPLDKGGAYAVQGRGRRLVTRVEGSLTNVVGLPLEKVVSMLAACGLSVERPVRRQC
ncbi:MAG TPA: nucleoside triphosphate pyrophosphatase [Candidatus Methanoperedens sp.]|nr:nucleoside triphosphate pyrophosphatase [Candidatus Methanoperedens sp.]